MARRLSEALQRASQRDAGLDREQLRAVAHNALNQIHSVRLATPHTINDNECPDTDDPEILARARQATAFKNNLAPTPFKGMAPELLTAITYDDSGAFTLHERRAAWSEAYDQDQAWRRQVVAEAMQEYSLTGRITKLYGQALDYYRALPAIEQAQMADDYEQKLLERINEILETPEQPHDLSLYDVVQRWLAPHSQPATLFGLMASESGGVLDEQPVLPKPATHPPLPARPDALAVKIALQKTMASLYGDKPPTR